MVYTCSRTLCGILDFRKIERTSKFPEYRDLGPLHCALWGYTVPIFSSCKFYIKWPIQKI